MASRGDGRRVNSKGRGQAWGHRSGGGGRFSSNVRETIWDSVLWV